MPKKGGKRVKENHAHSGIICAAVWRRNGENNETIKRNIIITSAGRGDL
jgi:hypothetical protein